jgi:formate dehydrogenase iron-sulfur subunit
VTPTVVYVPGDAAARSVGADEVATRLVDAAVEAGAEVQIVRNGSRGLLWLEPLVEVATASGRIAYGPVKPDDVPELVAAGLLGGADHPLSLGPTDAIPWLARQDRVTFARVGVVDPRSPDDYEATGGLSGLHRALELTPTEVIAAVTESGLRGRGGAGFPTGIKWTTVAEAPPGNRYVCCNADEGDSGTFADRMLIEGDPFLLIEGMCIAARAVGASEGFVYLRSEYPDAFEALEAAITAAYERGWLGTSILGSDLRFDLHLRVGAGSYVCGEETAMLESIEGKRGVVRAKPPLPALEGLFGRPTVVNNVLTLAAVPAILADGADAYRSRGTGWSRGTQVFQLGGNVARGGIVETAFGVTLGELVTDFGGGTRTGRPIRAIQVGGPLGAYLPASELDVAMDYEALAASDALLGHGGVVVFDDTADLAELARFAMEFCAEESCGKCTPCRVGAVRGVEVIERIIADEDRDANLVLLEDLCEVMVDGSLCAMGGLTPLPVRSALQHFPEDFARPGATVEGGRPARGQPAREDPVREQPAPEQPAQEQPAQEQVE